MTCGLWIWSAQVRRNNEGVEGGKLRKGVEVREGGRARTLEYKRIWVDCSNVFFSEW